MEEFHKAVYLIVAISHYSNLWEELGIKELDDNKYLHSDFRPPNKEILLPNNMVILYDVDNNELINKDVYFIRLMHRNYPLWDIDCEIEMDIKLLDKTFEEKWINLKDTSTLIAEGKRYASSPSRTINETQMKEIMEYSELLISNVENYLKSKECNQKQKVKTLPL